MEHKDRKLTRKKILIWFLLALWMSVIFLFSSQNADESGALSQGFLHRFILWLFPNSMTKNPETVDFMEFLLRKCAHMTEYAILGILIDIQMHCYQLFQKERKYVIAAVILVMLYACTDEFHQLFVAGRSGQFRDVMIDTCGGLIGILVYQVVKHRRRI